MMDGNVKKIPRECNLDRTCRLCSMKVGNRAQRDALKSQQKSDKQ